MADPPDLPQQPGLDMGALFESAQRMGEQLMKAQEEAAATIYQGQAGGGVVTIGVTGGFEFQSVSIDPGAVDPTDVEMLEDLVLAALRDAIGQVQEGQADGGGLDLGGLDLGGLLGGGAET